MARFKTMGLVTVALIAMLAPAHSFCIDNSVACELHELNDHLQRMEDNARWQQYRQTQQQFWDQVRQNQDEWFAMMNRWQVQIQQEIENAKTPEELALARKHYNQFSAVLDARLRAVLGGTH